MQSPLAKDFKAARRSGTPIVSVETLDQHSTISELMSVANTGDKKSPCYRWDIAAGLIPLNDLAISDLVELTGGADNLTLQTRSPVAALEFAEKLRQRSILFFCNAQAHLSPDSVRANPIPAQQVSNLRDKYKANLRTLVLLSPALTLDPILRPDVIEIDSPLPDEKTLEEIVKDQIEAAELEVLPYGVVSQAVTSVKGLSHFGAEQTIAMSLSPKGGIDLDFLGKLQRKTISKIDGLSMDLDTVTFDDIGGQIQIRRFMDGLFMSDDSHKLVVRIDEIDKMIDGGPASEGNTVSRDALAVLLRAMEDNKWSGLIAVGPGGSGKSLLTKAIGATYGVRTIAADLGGMKGSLVGESERKIREAMKIIHSLGGDKVLVLATCNKLHTLPPELKRRFTYGIWFFDLPTRDERQYIWRLHLGDQYGKVELPNDNLWTGAEIRNCCELAKQIGKSPADVAEFIVPIAKSDPEGLETLRNQANGRFLSVSYPGSYRKETLENSTTRRMRDDD